ncbi:MAG: hypothetical protein WA414_06745, partial [Acidobacteriaceae bacterium]
MGTMRSCPYCLLPRARRWVPGFLLIALTAAALPAAGMAATDAPAVKDANSYPAVDVHPKEKVAIAAEPFDTKEKCKIFQVDYLKFNMMPIRIIVTNMGDRPISLNDARIYFVDANGNRIDAAEPEDVERRTTPKERQGKDIPIGPIKLHTKGSATDSKIEADFDQFEYAALVVEPHTTRAGFLFYDMQGLGDTPLHGAKLVLRELKDADGNQLWYFEIPFDKYLDAQKKSN